MPDRREQGLISSIKTRPSTKRQHPCAGVCRHAGHELHFKRAARAGEMHRYTLSQ